MGKLQIVKLLKNVTTGKLPSVKMPGKQIESVFSEMTSPNEVEVSFEEIEKLMSQNTNASMKFTLRDYLEILPRKGWNILSNGFKAIIGVTQYSVKKLGNKLNGQKIEAPITKVKPEEIPTDVLEALMK